MQYTRRAPNRTCIVSGRVTTVDRHIIEAAAAVRSASISAYVAEVVSEAARRDVAHDAGPVEADTEVMGHEHS